MNFIVNDSSFARVVSEINKIISSKNVIPILLGVKIEADESGLKLTGSNSDIFLEKKIPIQIGEETILEIVESGSIVVASKILTEIVKKIPNEIQFISEADNSIRIRSGDIVTKLIGFKADEYPKLPELFQQNKVRIPLGVLTENIKKTAFAVSKNETKPVLTGVKIDFEKNKLICTATDSHRFARREVRIDSEIIGSLIVPRTSLNELLYLNEPDTSIVDIYYSDSYVVFTTENSSIYSRLIEGNYPNTQSFIPTASTTSITLNKKALLDGINRASVFSKEWKYNNVQLEIINETTIKISSSSTEIGMIEELQQIVSLEGQSGLKLSFDGGFLLDALKGIQEEIITISFDGLRRPIVIKPQNESTYLHLISPVRSY